MPQTYAPATSTEKLPVRVESEISMMSDENDMSPAKTGVSGQTYMAGGHMAGGR